MDRNRGYCFMTKQDRKVSNKLNLKKRLWRICNRFFRDRVKYAVI